MFRLKLMQGKLSSANLAARSATGYQSTVVFVFPRKCDKRVRQMDLGMDGQLGVTWGFESPEEGPPGKSAEPSLLSATLLARQGWAGASSVQQGLIQHLPWTQSCARS